MRRLPERARSRPRSGREDATLRRGVVGEVVVAIEVIVRDVQEHGHVGVEVAHGLELKAGDLHHQQAVASRGGSSHGLAQRRAQVATNEDRSCAALEHVAQELRHGALAVRARDGGEGSGEEA